MVATLVAWSFVFTAGPPEMIGRSVKNLTEASCRALSERLRDDMSRLHRVKTFGNCMKQN